MASCHACGTHLDDRMEIFRTTECPSCGSDLHVCLNCTFYDPGAHWQCRESIPEEVRDKDRANFCDYFRLRPGDAGPGRAKQDQRKEKARDAFNNLFGNG